MKRVLISLTLFLTIIINIYAQNTNVNQFASIDKKALAIPDSLSHSPEGIAGYINSNFSNDLEKTRAVFVWLAKNISYDYENMFAINFYESREEKIAKPLRTRKGICENYAALFNELCLKTGIKSYVIEGYTKQNGFNDYTPHAWCAARIDTSWFLFDPTWGSGYIRNGKFIRKIDNNYFKVTPSVMIKTHMPFDYLWQFLNYPITNAEFIMGKTTQDKKLKPFFNYPDTIAANSKLSLTDSLTASAGRIERNGVNNALIIDKIQHIRQQIENEKIQIRNKEIEATNKLNNMNVDSYNNASAEYNNWVNSLNNFINYRNNQFTPVKTDESIQAILNEAKKYLMNANTEVKQINNPDNNLKPSLSSLCKLLSEADTKTQEQQDWLNKYFSKSKSGRKRMFYKYSWYGIPLN